MNQAALLHALATQGEALAQAFVGLTDLELRWRPAEGKWSPIEILGHLVDEETGDFRPRLALTLEDPARPWSAIDPEAWVRERAHQDAALVELLGDFRRERAASLAWLTGLRAPDWSREHAHPKLGALRAGDLLAAWVAHDLLHLRQVANTRLAYVQDAARPYTTRYALP